MIDQGQLTSTAEPHHTAAQAIAPVEETVILGTSPALLIEGLLRARVGERLLFVDDALEIGGAWATTEAFGIRNIEGACHLMVNYRGTYETLSTLCGIQMEVHNPTPQVLEKERLIPFHSRLPVLRRSTSIILRMVLVAAIRCVESITANRWRFKPTRDYRFSHSFQNLSKRCLVPMFERESNRVARYPVGGSPEMLRKLRSELEQLGARFVRDAAEELDFTEGQPVNILLSSGKSIKSRHVVVSESVALSRLRDGDCVSQFPETNSDHIALILKVNGLDPNHLSYVELPFDPLVERVADVTQFCDSLPPDGSRILICENPGIGAAGDPDPDPHKMISYLKREEILPEELSVLDYRVHRLHLRKGDPILLKQLRACSPSTVTVIASRGDLTYSFHQNKARWEALASESALQI